MAGASGDLGEGSTCLREGGTAPEAASEEPRYQSRLYALDIFRFVAAWMVVGFHLVEFAAIEFHVDADQFFGHVIFKLSRYGWMGVQLFFLISGFVICMSSWGRSISQFFTSRFIRLMPAYWFAVALTTIVLTCWPLPGNAAPQLSQVLGNFTMIPPLLGVPYVDPVYWSLVIELKFYLLFAIVVWVGVNYRRVMLFCAIWTAAGLFALSANERFLIGILDPEWTPYFVAGITLYLIHRFGPTLLLWGMLGASWILSSIALNNEVAGMVKAGEAVNFTNAFLLLTVFFILMTVVALGGFSWLRWKGSIVVGALTYPVYLLHYWIGKTVLHSFRNGAPHWVLLGGVFAGILLLSYLVNRLVERPMARALRRGLKRSFEKIRTSDAGYVPLPCRPHDSIGPTGSTEVSARVPVADR